MAVRPEPGGCTKAPPLGIGSIFSQRSSKNFHSSATNAVGDVVSLLTGQIDTEKVRKS